MRRPTFAADAFAHGCRQRKAVTSRCFDEVNSSGFDHVRMMSRRCGEKACEVGLSTESCGSALCLFRRASVPSPAHVDTSVEDGEQVGGDVIDGTVAVDAVEQPLLVLPISEGRGLFVVG